MDVNMKPIALIFVAFLFCSCLENPKGSSAQKSDTHSTTSKYVRLKTIHGDILFKLFPDKAPITVERISLLVKEGFYNGLTFHRVVEDFVIQTGDPTATGSGGSGKNLKAEFNDLKHEVGTVAMARKGNDIHSADSQFYICFGNFPHLDSKYTIFGKVIEGIDVAKKVVKGDKIINASLE